MISSPHPKRRQQPKKYGTTSERSLELQEILQGLRLVLEMEPDYIDGAIDLLDEAIDIDRRRTTIDPPQKSQNLSTE